MVKRSKRMDEMFQLIRQEGNISVKVLAETMGVSDVTVRRDLDVLQSENLIRRSHGSAFYQDSTPSKTDNNYELQKEKEKKNIEKDAIGKYAVSLIQPNDVLMIDTGSTTDCLARCLPENMNLTVFCYNYNILSQLINKKGVDIIFSGGYFYPNDQLFVSDQGIDLVKKTRANKLFMSASGIHETLGVTCSHGYEVPIKRAALDSALTKILLADSSKFSKICPAYFAQISEIDAVVTDDGLSAQWRELLEQLDIEIHFV